MQTLCPLFLCVAVVGCKPCAHYFHWWQRWDANPVPIIFMCGSGGMQTLCPLFSLVAAVGCKPCAHYFYVWQWWDANPVPIIFIGGSGGMQTLCPLFSWMTAVGCKPCTHYVHRSVNTGQIPVNKPPCINEWVAVVDWCALFR